MVVSFFGTKGGTGTTVLAVNLAAEIRRLTSRSTVIADLKTGPGDVAVFLGLRAQHTLLDLIDRRAWTDPGTVSKLVRRHRCGLHVIPAGEAFGRPAPRDAEGADQTIRCLTGLYDVVVLDVGSTLTTCAATALQLSDLVMLVANPDVPCLRNLQRLVDAVRLAGVAGDRLHTVLNRAADSGVLTTPQIERVLGLPIAYSVTSDYRTIAAAVNAGIPVSALRRSPLGAQLEEIARELAAFGMPAQAPGRVTAGPAAGMSR